MVPAPRWLVGSHQQENQNLLVGWLFELVLFIMILLNLYWKDQNSVKFWGGSCLNPSFPSGSWQAEWAAVLCHHCTHSLLLPAWPGLLCWQVLTACSNSFVLGIIWYWRRGFLSYVYRNNFRAVLHQFITCISAQKPFSFISFLFLCHHWHL